MSLSSVPNCQDVSGACPKPLGSSSEKKHNSSPQASKIFRISGLQSHGEGLTTGGFVILSLREPSELSHT